MADVYDDFVTPMLLQFTLPKSADEDRKAFFRDYAEALGDFTSHELQHAAKLLKTTRTSRTFPVIADCLEACKHARDTLQPPAKRRHGSDAEKYPEWTPGRQRMADRMMNSEIGRQAADEGWIVALWDFCRKQQRWPDDREAKNIKSQALENWRKTQEIIDQMADDAYKKTNDKERGKALGMVSEFRRFSDSFVGKADRLKKIAYHGMEAA